VACPGKAATTPMPPTRHIRAKSTALGDSARVPFTRGYSGPGKLRSAPVSWRTGLAFQTSPPIFSAKHDLLAALLSPVASG